MSAFGVGAVTFGCAFVGALLGMLLRARLREHHLSPESRDVVKTGAGLIATMSALVLGLLVASTKSSFDQQRSEVTQLATDVIFLDRVLAHFGPETKPARELLRQIAETTIGQFWPAEGTTSVPPMLDSEALYDRIHDLAPKTEPQKALQAQALKTVNEISKMRWLMYSQQSSAISRPFLAIVIFWLAVIFVSFGLFAPRNLVALGTLFLCAVSVGAALFLIVELDRPYDGLLKISREPLDNALMQMGK